MMPATGKKPLSGKMAIASVNVQGKLKDSLHGIHKRMVSYGVALLAVQEPSVKVVNRAAIRKTATQLGFDTFFCRESPLGSHVITFSAVHAEEVNPPAKHSYDRAW